MSRGIKQIYFIKILESIFTLNLKYYIIVLGGKMNIFEERKSVRSFSNKKVDEKVLLEILEAARVAPSAKNRQPWKFCILSDKQKTEVVDLFYKTLIENNTEETGIATVKILRQCSKVVLVFMDYKEIEREGLSLIPYYLSVGASIENALLKATELGVGSLWIYDMIAIKDEILKMFYPEGMFISALAFGYEDKVLPRAKKKTLEEIIIKK